MPEMSTIVRLTLLAGEEKWS